MFALTTLAYPCVLAALCLGAGLLIDRASGGWLPGMTLPAVGAAGLVGVAQLTTYLPATAPATPYALVPVALAGWGLGRERAAGLARAARERAWGPATFILAYALALAPVLAAGRPSFSSFGALPDSAFHMLGADYLLRHGQDYGHLDLRNSYGQYINAYYATGYPVGADALFGAGARLVGAPLIWALQPFDAFALALAAGPLWTLMRRAGLRGGLCALATLTATLPALVYGYELVASVKEIVALGPLLTLGVLAAAPERWLWRGARGAIPFALATAAGVATLGVGFGAWALAGALVPGALAAREIGAGRRRPRELWGALALAAAIVLAGALGTWTRISGALHTATGIATTSNSGNLKGGLHLAQVFGVWLDGSYAQTPAGAALGISYALIALTLAAAALGALRLFHTGERALLAWIALTVALGLGLRVFAGVWVGAKALLLTSPAILLLAWSGVAALRGEHGRGRGMERERRTMRGRTMRGRRPGRGRGLGAVAVALGALLTGGIAVSDALQYHDSNLAPTARYDELARIDARFAGRGPILFGGFDEYTLYQLRDLDVGGVDFLYPPAGLRQRDEHGYPVNLDRIPAPAWAAYPLALTRRDPGVSEPPAAYRLAWEGAYYQVWARRPGAPAAIVHVGLSPMRTVNCARIRGLARVARAHGAVLVAARAPEIVSAPIAHASHPGWRYTHPGLVMSGAGTLRTGFTLPRGGAWQLWLKGQAMPPLHVSVDGRPVGSLAGQLDGNAHNPSPLTPLPVRLAAGPHRLTIARADPPLAPGSGGWAILHEAFLTPARPAAAGEETPVTAPGAGVGVSGDAPHGPSTAAPGTPSTGAPSTQSVSRGAPDADTLLVRSPARWRTLCGGRYDWVEVTRRGY